MGKFSVPFVPQTKTDQLREDLNQCEIWVSQIGISGKSAPSSETSEGMAASPMLEGVNLLQLLDQIAEELEQLEQSGSDLRPERTQFESIQNQLRSRKGKFVALFGHEVRVARPSNARWWWHLDEELADERQRLLKRLVIFATTSAVLLLVLYFVYDRFLAPPKSFREASSLTMDGERSVSEGDLVKAIQQFETAAALEPELPDAHLWLGVLYQKSGESQKSDQAFQTARKLIGSESGFLFQRGTYYLQLNDLASAKADAQAAIQAAPQQPEGYFLLGNVTEQAGDLQKALDAFQQADQYAGSTGQYELQVVVRQRIGGILQRIGQVPGP